MASPENRFVCAARADRFARAARAVATLAAVAMLSGASCNARAATRIVLIGGTKSEGPAQHDYPNGIHALKALLDASPDARAVDQLVVDAHPQGWPSDRAALSGAATIVWYFDGLEKHPLLDATRRAQFEAAMNAGSGLIALHQATTLPAADTTAQLQRWLGGARHGMFDRTTEMVRFEPARHAVARGVGTFTYRDEFYPTIRFLDAGRDIVPILEGKLHVEFREGRHLVLDRPTVRTVAWGFERGDGGRSFGFSGTHYLASLDEPAVRKLLLNAIFWTARLEVPQTGVRDGLPGSTALQIAARARQDAGSARNDAGSDSAIREAIVTRPAQNEVIDYPWGRITWYVSGKLGNSQTLTVGQALIRPARENPRHYHPNCDEVLRVARGRILHTMGDRSVEMSAGDTVSIPTGVRHNARNIGSEDAVLDISFSTADRQVVGE